MARIRRKTREENVTYRIVSIALLATMLLVACGPKATPIPVEPTMVLAEPTAVPVEPMPEPAELLMWSEWCGYLPPEGCTNGVAWNEEYCVGNVEPGDLGRQFVIEWHKLHPEYQHVDIKCIIATYGGGRIGQELIALVRAGAGPNLYTLYGGRAWLAQDIGIDLDKYLSEDDKADYLDYERWRADDGSVLVLPGWGSRNYISANATLIERACAQEGFDCEVPESWSIVPYGDYLEIAEAIKALDDGSYVGILFGVAPSSQHLNWVYFAQAGIPAFKDGRFTGFEGGEDVLAELLRLYDEGYLYPDVAGIDGGDAFAIWDRGELAFFQYALEPARRDKAVAAGECEHWDMIPLFGIEFEGGTLPLISGTSHGMAGFVADNTPEELREAAASFVAYAVEVPWYKTATPNTVLVTHSQVVDRGLIVEPHEELDAYIAEHGLADAGLQHEAYNLVREATAEMLAAVFLHDLTPGEGLAQFQATIAELQGD